MNKIIKVICFILIVAASIILTNYFTLKYLEITSIHNNIVTVKSYGQTWVYETNL